MSGVQQPLERLKHMQAPLHITGTPRLSISLPGIVSQWSSEVQGRRHHLLAPRQAYQGQWQACGGIWAPGELAHCLHRS